jgi:signal transduction histidine kinase
MFSSHPRSFRRLLIVRLLLLGVPILLIGQYFTLRKGRTNLLETARQNLSSSAVRKGDLVGQNLHLLQSNLQTLSQTTALQQGDDAAISAQVRQFIDQIPLSAACIQVNAGTSDQELFNNCSTPLPIAFNQLPWAGSEAAPSASTVPSFYLTALDSPTAPPSADEEGMAHAQVTTVVSVPVYSPEGRLRYTLSLQAQLHQLHNTGARSLVGDTTLIDADGRVRVHPDPTWVGQSIQDLPGSDRWDAIVRRAQNGDSATLHIFHFLDNTDTEEWLAGYAPLEVPIAPGQRETWTVLAVTPIDHALYGLRDIRDLLLLFTLGLLAAQVLLVLYLARGLSQPMERLCTYAQAVQDLSEFKEVPQNFRVWELDHLAKVLNRMLQRIEQRARELQHAWQEAQMANQLKSEFLANTSHELRTPLNAIIGCIRLVRDDCCDSEEEKEEFLTRADQAAIHLLAVINDILDIAKIESGTLELYVETLDVRAIIGEVIQLQTVQAQQKGLQLRAPALDHPLWVRADRSKLKQVLLNVVYNAIKFTETGEVALYTTVEPGETDPELESDGHSPAPDHRPQLPVGIDLPTPLPRLLISIRDTGIGVDPKQQAKLFQPFVMADGSTTRRFEGTGLGLAISRDLMTLMEGSITLYSEGLGQGTLVVIALPLLSTETAVDSLGESPAPASRDRLTSPSH